MQITVNGTKTTTDATTLTYKDVVELTHYTYYPGIVLSIMFSKAAPTITYNGDVSRTEGILSEGQTIHIIDGTRINCYDTSSA